MAYPGDHSIQTIYYCPWCGQKLPKELGDEWVARLEAMGIDPGDDDADRIPEAFRSDRWWKEAGL
ncbi:DUF6980 family protein [Carbonactinospora thermoautotrophica]|uniref:DUF6980 family protein n=1 Tax=Carbonactinospora thermoautotrophica TaxID=1469144 RepID=UPI0035586580